MGDIERLLRPELAALPGYEPIEPIDQLSARLGITPEQVIKLDGNENLYGLSPRAQEAICGYRQYHIYPDPEQRQIRRALSRYVGVGEEHLLAGAGSDELIDLVIRAFVGPGDGVIDCQPTFGMYRFLTLVAGGRVIDVPRGNDFSLDVSSATAAARNARLLFVASPNNPSGNRMGREELDALLGTGIVIVVDEAYGEFAGESFASLVPERENLIVLRTFSKWAGLAGLRAGYGIFPLGLVEVLMKIQQPYNVNAAAQAAVLASIEDAGLLLERVQTIVRERERLYEALRSLPFLTPYPSAANFILCRLIRGDAKGVWLRLRERGIIIRYFDSPAVRDCLRISVGLPEHTDALMAALREIGGELRE